MERFPLAYEYDEIPDAVLTAHEIAERKIAALESQSLFKSVVESDGLTSLFQLMLQPAMPLL